MRLLLSIRLLWLVLLPGLVVLPGTGNAAFRCGSSLVIHVETTKKLRGY